MRSRPPRTPAASWRRATTAAGAAGRGGGDDGGGVRWLGVREGTRSRPTTSQAGLLLGGGALALGQDGADNGLTTTETTTVEQPGDVSGPCDEAEHANDPRCNGAQGQKDGRRDDDDDDGAGDISGPCDEAEHANDPRCTGAGGDRVDNSGPGSANSGHGNGHDDDEATVRTTPVPASPEANSGPGNSHDDGDGDDDRLRLGPQRLRIERQRLLGQRPQRRLGRRLSPRQRIEQTDAACGPA